jgi:hypothetical protein
MRTTYTYAILEVSPEAYNEIAKLLKDAGYHGAFQKDDGSVVIDMHGIALKNSKAEVRGEVD